MKKLLPLLVALISVYQASAQSADSLQTQPTVISIDSLSVQLNKLQHDYNFLYCRYELGNLLFELKDLSQKVNIAANELVTTRFHYKYNREFDTSHVNLYSTYKLLFEQIKKNVETTKTAVFLKIITSDFSDEELNVIKSYFAIIQASIRSVESALEKYDSTIRAYQNLR